MHAWVITVFWGFDYCVLCSVGDSCKTIIEDNYCNNHRLRVYRNGQLEFGCLCQW